MASEARTPWGGRLFALVAAIPGNLNYAVLAYATLPVVPAALYLVFVERSVPARRVFSWLVGAVVLFALLSAPSVGVTAFYAEVISANLALTELPSHIASNSSWAESWRGLGWWLTYFSSGGGGLDLRQFAGYFRWPPTVLAPFAAPLVAVAAVCFSRARVRLLFGVWMVAGVALMAGAYPADDPTPYGRLFLRAVEDIVLFRGFRGTYKAVPVLALGVAGLVGLATAGLQRMLQQRGRVWHAAAASAAVGVFVLASFPFWTGSLYRPTDTMRSIPDYWYTAMQWLDRAPGQGRVLVVPSTVNAVFTWGAAGVEFFDSLMTRKQVVRPQIGEVLGTAESANLLQALFDHLESGHYEAGTFAPIARRVGIEYLVVRNDLDWRATRRPPPRAFDALRQDPDLELVHTFGEPGENVLRAHRRPSSRPPVEVFRVRGVAAIVRTTTRPALLVSGDGASWPSLAASGLLDAAGPVRYTGSLSNTDAVEALAGGSLLVVTDTNRRRDQQIPHAGALGGHSYTLTSREPRTRDVVVLFDHPGAESVAYYRDAVKVVASLYGTPWIRDEPWSRPSNAFDGSEWLAWRFGSFDEDPTGEWVQVQLRRTALVGALEVAPAPASDERRISRITAIFSDGSRVPLTLGPHRIRVEFTPRLTRSIRFRIDEVSGDGRDPVALTEIAVDGLDLRELVQVPEDLARRATRDGRLRAALGDAAIRFQFNRLGPPQADAADLESDLRRRFRVPVAREFVLAGTMRFSEFTPAPLRAALTAGTIRAGEVPRPVGSDKEFLDCHADVILVDGQYVEVQIDADASALVDQRPVRFQSCAPVRLGAGWHTVENALGTQVDELHLETGVAEAGTTHSRGAKAYRSSSGRVDARVDAPPGSFVTIGESFHPGWSATGDRRDIEGPIRLDTQTGFVIGEEGARTVSARFEPEQLYRGSLLLATAGLLVCSTLIVGSWRSARPSARGRPRSRSRVAEIRPEESG